MATKQLLQILLKSREGIKSGAIKVKDVVEEYLTSTGARTISPEERYTINKEFTELAPSNVIGDIFGDFQGLQKSADDVADEITESKNVEEVFFGPGDTRLGGARSKTPFTDLVEQERGVKLRGDESFGELMEKLGPVKEEGLASLFPRGKPGEIFDVNTSKREEVAEFIKKMREAGIKNKDIKGVFKESGTDLAQGKKAATTLARAADMKADTAIKQEALADLDDDIANYGPNWWKGLGYNDGPMGYDSYGDMSRNIIGKINNGIMDDLEKAGVPEEKVTEIFTFLSDARKRLANDPKAFVRKVADELEIEDIDYDVSFWDNYVDEIMSRIEKPEPRFEYGGVV